MTGSFTEGSTIQAEHLIYGSFADRPGGYHVRFRTSGITEQIASAVVERCDNWGEILDPEFPHSLMSLPIPSHQTKGAGPLCMVDLVSQVGVDSSGRRGAQMHHALVLTPEEFDAVGADPFLLLELGALSPDGSGSAPTHPVEIRVPSLIEWHTNLLAQSTPDQREASLRVAVWLLDRKKVLFWEENKQEDVLVAMRLAWILLPRSARTGVRLATFAFLNRNDLDLGVIYSNLATSQSHDVRQIAHAPLDESRLHPHVLDYLNRLRRELEGLRFREAVEIACAG